MAKKTIAYFIEQLIGEYKDRRSLVYKKEFRTERWSYSDLYDCAHQIAGLFKEKGLKKGDKVIIHCYNCPEWGAILLACALSGVIAVPIDFNSKSGFVLAIAKKVGARLVFSSRFKPVGPRHGEIFVEDLKGRIQKYHGFRCRTKIEEDDILEIVYTSGTTSDPKGVIITNRNLVSNIQSLRKCMPLDGGLVFLSVVPMSHLLEQTVGFFVPLRFGCRIVYTPSRKSSAILGAMREERVTAMVGVPILLETLKDRIEREVEKKGKMDSFQGLLRFAHHLPFFMRRLIFREVISQLGSRLKFFVVGGAPLDPGTERFGDSLGILVLQGYGLTETSPILSCNTLARHKEGTVGKVLPDQKVIIAEDGEIVCKGDNVTRGYYQNREATVSAIRDGWFHTGDFGEFDGEGYLIIKGRKKNMILTSSGLNVYPEDIERAIKRIGAIQDSVVLGVREKKDVIITAVVIPQGHRELKNADKNKLIDEINSGLSSHQRIQRMFVWPDKDFPRTSSLKIRRKDVEERLVGCEEQDSRQSAPSDALCGMLAKLSNVDVTDIRPGSVLSTDLAIDSMHRVELVSLIEEEFNVGIEESKITEKTNVKDLRRLIAGSSARVERGSLSRLNTSRAMIPLRAVFQEFTFMALRVFYPVEVEGMENLEGVPGPVIFAINHSSHLDTPTLLRALPMRFRSKIAFAAAQDYFFDAPGGKGRSSWKDRLVKRSKLVVLETLLNIYPFSREGNIRQSLRFTGRLLDEGFSIGIYPEGTRTVTGEIGAFKAGIGLIAVDMEVPVIPVKIRGLYDILPKGSFIPRFGRARVSFGRPIAVRGEGSYIKVAKDIEERLRSL